jgi:hypothetical protein
MELTSKAKLLPSVLFFVPGSSRARKSKKEMAAESPPPPSADTAIGLAGRQRLAIGRFLVGVGKRQVRRAGLHTLIWFCEKS